jgi:hypothetical protein
LFVVKVTVRVATEAPAPRVVDVIRLDVALVVLELQTLVTVERTRVVPVEDVVVKVVVPEVVVYVDVPLVVLVVNMSDSVVV